MAEGIAGRIETEAKNIVLEYVPNAISGSIKGVQEATLGAINKVLFERPEKDDKVLRAGILGIDQAIKRIGMAPRDLWEQGILYGPAQVFYGAFEPLKGVGEMTENIVKAVNSGWQHAIKGIQRVGVSFMGVDMEDARFNGPTRTELKPAA